MDDNFDLDGFMNKYGALFVTYFKQELNAKRLSAPGFTGRAYASKGRSGDTWKARNKRNRDFADMRPRSAFGRPLNESIEYQYNDNTKQLAILMADYWQVVDEGRNPGSMPPLEPIRQWISEKTNLPLEAAFAIGRNIYKFGIVPNGFYGRATDRIAAKMEKDFGDDFSDYLDQFFDNLLEPNRR